MGLLKKAWMGQVLVAGMIILYAVYFMILPDTVPCHWNIKGEIDGYSGKYNSLVLILIFGGGIYIFFRILPLISLIDKESAPAFKLGEFIALRNSTLLFFLLLQFASYDSMRTGKITFLLPAVLIGLILIIISTVKLAKVSKRIKTENRQDK